MVSWCVEDKLPSMALLLHTENACHSNTTPPQALLPGGYYGYMTVGHSEPCPPDNVCGNQFSPKSPKPCSSQNFQIAVPPIKQARGQIPSPQKDISITYII